MGNKKSRGLRRLAHLPSARTAPAGPNFVGACLITARRLLLLFAPFLPLSLRPLLLPLLHHSEHCWQAAMQRGDERGLHYNCKTPHATRGERGGHSTRCARSCVPGSRTGGNLPPEGCENIDQVIIEGCRKVISLNFSSQAGRTISQLRPSCSRLASACVSSNQSFKDPLLSSSPTCRL